MFPEWTSSVDMLADAGVIDFDAAAYITGAPARFVGTPQYPIYNIPPLAIQSPVKDEFKRKSFELIVKTPFWKKALLGILGTAGVIWGISKIRKTPVLVKSIGNKITDFFKSIFKKKT